MNVNLPPKPDYVSENLWRLIYITDFSESERELWLLELPTMSMDQKKKFEEILVNNEKTLKDNFSKDDTNNP